ncbi:MAG TPA: HAMP domain-containing sensor histidine kinase [Pseudonocardiaceae bacterium]|jgi:two-component system sensor histidine kinase MprB|nr:HAMP domain-containing sensor histidine kinase [Pseudonocardiaceae bacterium]
MRRPALRRPTLRRRLTVLTAAAVAVAVVGVSVAAWLLLRGELRDETAQDLTEQASVFAQRTDPTKLQSPPAWVKPDVNTLLGVVSSTGASRKPPFQSRWLPVDAGDVAVALGTEESALRDVTVDRVSYLMLTVHSVRGDAVQIASDMTDVNTTLNHFALLLGVADLVAIVVAAAMGYGFTVAGLRPVRRVGAAAAHVAATQDLGAAVPMERREPAEVASVAASMNQMLAALGHARDAQRQLVEDASHELATPLTSLRTNIELLLHAERNPDRQLDSDDRERLLKDVDAQLGELDHLVEEVVELARDPGSAEETTDLDLADVVRSAVVRARARSPEVIFELAETPVLVLGKRSLVERAVLNLLDNAAKWSPPEAPVEITVGRVRGLADVLVADRGPGVPEADRERVFQRFYRTAEARAMPGSGLGLAIVRQVVTVHGGRAWLAARSGGGTEAHMQIPVRRGFRPPE